MNGADWFRVLAAAALIVVGITAQPAPPAVSIMYPVARERLDYVATAGQTVFQTQVLPRSNYVEVFRNGLLQRAPVDYTVSTIPGALKVTFVNAQSATDTVSLFYYR